MTATRTTHRTDGLDNPLSPNSGGCTWQDVLALCAESGAVDSCDLSRGVLTIEWCDGNVSRLHDPQAALIEIRAMSAC